MYILALNVHFNRGLLKMHTATFSELRRQAKKYLDAVEQGETVRITRRGKVIASIIPTDNDTKPSWKNPALKLAITGAELSKYILNERNESNK
jgi:prevent-host-death family protein